MIIIIIIIKDKFSEVCRQRLPKTDYKDTDSLRGYLFASDIKGAQGFVLVSFHSYMCINKTNLLINSYKRIQFSEFSSHLRKYLHTPLCMHTLRKVVVCGQCLVTLSITSY